MLKIKSFFLIIFLFFAPIITKTLKEPALKVSTDNFTDDKTGFEASKISDALKESNFLSSYFKFSDDERERIIRLGFEGFGDPLDAIKDVDDLNPFEIFIYKVLLLINYVSRKETEKFKPKYKFIDLPAMLPYLFAKLTKTIDIDGTIDAHGSRAEDMEISGEDFAKIKTFTDLVQMYEGLYDRTLIQRFDFSDKYIDKMLDAGIKELFKKTNLHFKIENEEQSVPLRKFLFGTYESYKMIDDVDFDAISEVKLDKYQLSSVVGSIIFKALKDLFEVNKLFGETKEGERAHEKLIVEPSNKLREWEKSADKAKKTYEQEVAQDSSKRRLGAYPIFTPLYKEKKEKRKKYVRKLLFFKQEEQESIWQFFITSLSWVKKQSSKEDFDRVKFWLEPVGNIGFDLDELLSSVGNFSLSGELGEKVEEYEKKLGETKDEIVGLAKKEKERLVKKKDELKQEALGSVGKKKAKAKKVKEDLKAKAKGLGEEVKKFQEMVEELIEKTPEFVGGKKIAAKEFIEKKKEQKKKEIEKGKSRVIELFEKEKEDAAKTIESKKQAAIKKALEAERKGLKVIEDYEGKILDIEGEQKTLDETKIEGTEVAPVA